METDSERQIRTVPISHLDLDRDNPRLLGSVLTANDETIIAELYRTAELQELFQSVSANGYLDIEPLIVKPNPNDSSRLLVLEGNRRLATLRLLTDRDLVTRLEAQENIRVNIPVIPPSLAQTLNQVTVYQVRSREDARSFIGFKHINGPAKWTAYAKAQFAANWYKEIRGTRDDALREVAHSIGDRHATIKRMVFAVYILEQAQATNMFIVDDRYTTKFNFSHLYTALSRSQYMKFLGIEGTWSRYDPSPNAVPDDKLNRLKEVLLWIYGSRPDDIPPLIRVQNPHIKELGEVLENSEALLMLRRSASLRHAHAATESAGKRFSDSLFRARDALQGAANALRGYDGANRILLDVCEDIKETASSVYYHLKRKVKERNMS